MPGPTRKLAGGKGTKGAIKAPKGIPDLSKAQIGLKKIKEATRKVASVPDKGPPKAEATIHPVITPAMVKAAGQPVTVNGLPCTICGGAVRHVPNCPTRRPVGAPPAERPSASEGNWLPWEPSRTGSVNSPTFQRDRRHQLDCAAAWLFNWLEQEARLYPVSLAAYFVKSQDIVDPIKRAREAVLQAMELFDRRAAEEALGYKPTATVDQIRRGITQEEYEREQKGVQDSRGSAGNIAPAIQPEAPCRGV